MDGDFIGLNRWGIYDLNGQGIYDLIGWGMYDLNGWGIYNLIGLGIYDKCAGRLVFCWRYAQKTLVFRGVPFPVLT